ncbi:MAG: TatD family hydrolase [Succinivibrio sp.]|nr:TatD family hydrolase [Succinivibrio sp.]
MLTDCHIHLSLFADPVQVCTMAAQHRIRLVGVGCDVADSCKTLSLAAEFGITAMTGIHPWYAGSEVFPFEDFERFFASGLLRGIGECGLDAEIPLGLDSQIELLRGHLDFAASHDLPVNLHIRKCHDVLIRLLKTYRGTVRGIIHNFTFSKELAKEYLDLDFFLSVGHHVLYKSAKLCNTIRYAGAQRLLLETDADELHSGPYDPALLYKEAQALSEILGIEVAMLEETLEQNYVALMRLEK